MSNSDQTDHGNDSDRDESRRPPPEGESRSLVAVPGLPDEWDEKFIPDPDALETAALKAMHEVRAFLLVHRDDPASVGEHLDWLAGLVRAAVTVKGRHRAKAVKLGLALTREHWIKANKLDRWQGFLLNLLSSARDIGDPVLEAEVYRVWGVCLNIQGGQPKAERALENALEIASTTLRTDLALLARLELFNVRATRTPEDAARIEAEAILVAARPMRYTYLIGRVNLTLARMYTEWLNHAQAFHYAQQAFVIFVHQKFYDAAGQALVLMLASLQGGFVGSDRYRQQILNFMESHPAYLNDFTTHSVLCRNQAIFWYRRKDYETARRYAVNAYKLARATFYPSNPAYCCHMIALVHIELGRWSAARYYLMKAIERFRVLDRPASRISAAHALAHISFAQEDFASAIVQLSEVLEDARQALDPVAFQHIQPDIEGDLEHARRQLAQQSATNE